VNTFAWLLMGHLVGDWVLQNDWMARGKIRGLFTLAGLVHVTIYTVAIFVALWLSGAPQPSWASWLISGGMVFLSHWLIDAAGAAGQWMRFYRQSDLEMVRVAVDQTLHLLVLVGLIVIPGG